jgi:hypothetical protein
MPLDRHRGPKTVNVMKPWHDAGWSVAYDLLKERF